MICLFFFKYWIIIVYTYTSEQCLVEKIAGGEPPSCDIRLQVETLKAAYAMEFAVEEINRNPLILPGVKLNYRILDDCGLNPWVLQGAFSLVGGGTESCDSTTILPQSHVSGPSSAMRGTITDWYDEVPSSCIVDWYSAGTLYALLSSGGQSVPLIIGGASSTTAIILSRTLASLSVPVVSFTSNDIGRTLNYIS